MAKILIIEDDPYLLDNTIEALQYEGFEIVAAEDGLSGIESALKLMPNLILCDMMLPLADGYTVLQAVRGDARTACIPFIFVSAMSQSDVIAAALERGADAYITKPFELRQLLQIVSKFVSNP